VVIGTEMVARTSRDKPLFLLDLALPHDVDPGVRMIPGVTLVDLESMQEAGLGGEGAEGEGGAEGEIAAVRSIVAAEVCEYLRAERAAKVTPTVVALRAKAADVVESELGRLVTRVPEIDDRLRGEIAQTVRRVVDKLLHEPTVRVKRLAASPAGDHYAEALRELFDLNPKVPEAVTRAEVADVETDSTGRAGEENT
jgi:glutamyl-tRNA reductase